jgi:hypothetical protein
MSAFDANLEKMERTLGRSLSGEEVRLLRLWELTAGTADSSITPQESNSQEESEAIEEYEGQFKIAFARGQYEVYFVCSGLRMKPVLIQEKEDVVCFLTLEDFFFDDLMFRQSVAAAESRRPTLVGPSITVQEVVLRSMGFSH